MRSGLDELRTRVFTCLIETCVTPREVPLHVSGKFAYYWASNWPIYLSGKLHTFDREPVDRQASSFAWASYRVLVAQAKAMREDFWDRVQKARATCSERYAILSISNSVHVLDTMLVPNLTGKNITDIFITCVLDNSLFAQQKDKIYR